MTYLQLAEVISYWATTLGIVVALIGAVGAYWKYRADRWVAKSSSAKRAYTEFVDIAIANPEICPNHWTDVASQNAVAKNKYLWFMARFVWAAEDVLLCGDGDPVWPYSIKIVVREHVDFFMSETGAFETAHCHSSLRQIIFEIITEAEREAERGGGVEAPSTNELPTPNPDQPDHAEAAIVGIESE